MTLEYKMIRESQAGRLRFDLIPTFFLKRLAQRLTDGAVKYGERNFELACSDEEIDRFKASAWRHFIQYMEGDTDEDHMAAVCFNLLGCELAKNNKKEKEKNNDKAFGVFKDQPLAEPTHLL